MTASGERIHCAGFAFVLTFVFFLRVVSSRQAKASKLSLDFWLNENVGFALVFIYDDFLSALDKSSYSEISHRFAIFIYKSDAEVTHAGTVYDSSMNDVRATFQCDTL